MKKAIVIEIICFLFIVLFVYAAVSKLADIEEFRVQIGNSPLLTGIAGIVAWIIPAAEIAISAMLSIQQLRLIGLYAAFSLMLMFTFYIIFILTLAEKIPCSCGGVLEKLGWTEHLIFNIVFVLLAITCIFLQSNQEERKHTAIVG